MLILSQEPPKQLASSMVTGDDSAQARISQCEQQKTLAVARKRGDSIILCIRVYELDKLTKHSQKTLDMGRLHGRKYLCKNLGVEEGEGRLLEGGTIVE